MLLAATVDDSDSVFVDLLTYADLEALKSKRAGAPPRAAPSSKTNNKRYLILTYAAEFDRVHYPLPLLHEDAPSADALRATVARLKRENAKLAAGVAGGDGGFIAADTTSEGLKIIGEENTKLREENDTLRTQVRQLQREVSRAPRARRAPGGESPRLDGARGVSFRLRRRLRARGKPSRGAQGGHHRTSSDASRARRREPRGAGGADGRGERGVVQAPHARAKTKGTRRRARRPFASP